MKNNFQKKNFYKHIAKFDNNQFIFQNWKRSSCSEFFSEKMINYLSESQHFQKFSKNRYEKKHLKIKFLKYITFLCFKFFIE